VNPDFAVKQKAQPILQPAWVERQSVPVACARDENALDQKTVLEAKEDLLRRVFGGLRPDNLEIADRARFSMSARNSFERFVISAKEEAPCW